MNRTTIALLASLLLAGCQTIPGMGPGETTQETQAVEAVPGQPADAASIPDPQAQSPQTEPTPESTASPAQAEPSDAVDTAPDSTGAAQINCQRKVLRRYCLGESAQALLARHTPLQRAQSENRMLLLFRDGERLTRVTAFDGQVLVVSRFYSKPDWNLLVGLHRQLTQIYGKGTDRSRFPSTATDRVKQEQAIREGKGEVRILWKQPGYRVQLLWQAPQRILLSFLAEELKQRLENKPETESAGSAS